MNLDPINILAPPIVAVGFLLLVWTSDRTITRGRPLTPHMKKVLLYSFFFVLGIGYLILWQDELGLFFHWRSAWIFLILTWGAMLASIAWWRHRQIRAVPETPPKFISAVLTEGLPALALMVCVIAGAVEWEYIFQGQGRWWVGVLWLMGVAASILAARHNRRTSVIMVLRGVVALLMIGAIAERTSPALIIAALAGLVLLFLEKFWRSSVVKPGRG